MCGSACREGAQLSIQPFYQMQVIFQSPINPAVLPDASNPSESVLPDASNLSDSEGLLASGKTV
jgi:hypothetical protein